MVNGWKVTAIIFIVLFLMMLSLLFYGLYLEKKEVKDTMECYYDFCSENVDANFDVTTGVCTCYDYDLLGELKYVKSGVIG